MMPVEGKDANGVRVGKAYARYLLRSLFLAFVYLLIGRLLWPDDTGSTTSVTFALTLGLMTQSIPFLRDLLGIGEDDPLPPIVYLGFGVTGLSAVAAWCFRPPRPAGFLLFAAILAAAFCLYYLVRGARGLWRDRRAKAGRGG